MLQSITECSKGSILKYFQPSLSYDLSLRSLFCLFWSGRFTQVLLYLVLVCGVVLCVLSSFTIISLTCFLAVMWLLVFYIFFLRCHGLICGLCLRHFLVIVNCFKTMNSLPIFQSNLAIYSGPQVIKLFPCSTQLGTKFILLINVKMPTIVGILTFISMINTTSEILKAMNFFICRYLSFYE